MGIGWLIPVLNLLGMGAGGSAAVDAAEAGGVFRRADADRDYRREDTSRVFRRSDADRDFRRE